MYCRSLDHRCLFLYDIQDYVWIFFNKMSRLCKCMFFIYIYIYISRNIRFLHSTLNKSLMNKHCSSFLYHAELLCFTHTSQTLLCCIHTAVKWTAFLTHLILLSTRGRPSQSQSSEALTFTKAWILCCYESSNAPTVENEWITDESVSCYNVLNIWKRIDFQSVLTSTATYLLQMMEIQHHIERLG